MRIDIKNQTLVISEQVTMSAVRKQDYEQFCHHLQMQKISEIDLSQVTESDSACVALLVAAKRIASHHALDLHVNGIPAGLSMLMTLYGVEEWIQ
ncbi:STAS domain-containing protein [Neisseriaceae bacterium ESL0693]|nr:STAS domain-containing protein [Neisseriaceae bacterium ESL0693]